MVAHVGSVDRTEEVSEFLKPEIVNVNVGTASP